MYSYISPMVVLVPSPVGLDAHIATVQARLATLPWIQTVYGKALAQREQDAKGKTTIFPEVWGKNREPENVMINDNLKAYAFFVVRDPGTFIDYDPGDIQMQMQQPMSCIVWANLFKIDPVRKYRFTEELKQALLAKLREVRNVSLTTIYEQWDRVFDPFTITETYRQYMKPPYYAVRFDFVLSYAEFEENCAAAAYPDGILLNENGEPLLNEDGSYLYAEDPQTWPPGVMLAENELPLLAEDGSFLYKEEI